MVSSLYSESPTLRIKTSDKKKFAGEEFYVRHRERPGNRFHRARMENLHNFEKILTTTVYYEKSWSILKSTDQKF